ncbi:VOC family protein [Microlunatus speluncae]|uniref:VOC family protein n=1 Tax=Microlunatus speluncae TaxID=2594267 RepID=UPI001FEBC076|nr:VOC family protein [Microlunatus speluncae]
MDLEAAVAHLLADEDGMTVYFGCPDQVDGRDGKAALADFYGALLGWPRRDAWGTPFLSKDPKFRIGFDRDGWSDLRPPRWGDPEHPQQLHFDFAVPELAPADERAAAAGATLLHDEAGHRSYADPVGHAFCLYPDPRRAEAGPAVARLVYDCFSPRSLATFYQAFLGVADRLEDSPNRVVINLADDELPDLAFHQAQVPAPRWPDPAYPAQLHADYRFSVDHELPHFQTPAGRAAIQRAEQLGAIYLQHVVYADPAGHPFCF